MRPAGRLLVAWRPLVGRLIYVPCHAEVQSQQRTRPTLMELDLFQPQTLLSDQTMAKKEMVDLISPLDVLDVELLANIEIDSKKNNLKREEEQLFLRVAK